MGKLLLSTTWCVIAGQTIDIQFLALLLMPLGTHNSRAYGRLLELGTACGLLESDMERHSVAISDGCVTVEGAIFVVTHSKLLGCVSSIGVAGVGS